jgi:ABC-type bacteriocin/lantibiotic exporter with double-glycine peptidase domain
MRPLTTFVTFGSTLQELTADMDRLDDVLRYPVDSQYQQVRESLCYDPNIVKLSGRIELRDITFGYSPLDPPLIDKFNLKVEPGRRVALVGGSGSGKSTIARLLSGLYTPWSGEVLFDGRPRREIPRELIVNSLAVVDQELFLFGGTVVDNVTMWDGTVSGQRVGTACRDAAIAAVVEAREGAYQSMVQEGGGNFSGGQCQRLEIARSLASEPTMIILDEATSALDPTTELHIDDSMRRRGCTAIIIAHRLSTIRDADEIIVMERGRIVQRGTHDELRAIEGPYQYLIAE